MKLIVLLACMVVTFCLMACSSSAIPPAPQPADEVTPTATSAPVPPTSTLLSIPTSTPPPTATSAPVPPTSTPLSIPTSTPPPTATSAPVLRTSTPLPYYTQFVDAAGVRVKASAAVDARALEVGANTIRHMLAHRPDIAQRMSDAGAALAIIPKDRYITEIPELSYLQGRQDPNGNPYDSFMVRGAGGIAGQTTTVTSEENLLGSDEDRTRFWAEDITVHEWAHTIENLGFDDATRGKWRELFDRAREVGLWPGTFAMTVDEGREFFAELSQSFFEANNEIGGREELGGNGQEGVLADIFEALEDVYGQADVIERPRGE